MQTYSIEDRQCARIILDNANSTDMFLYTSEMVEWAEKVEKWFKSFYSLLSKTAKKMKSAALAMKTIWHNLKQGISLKRQANALIEKTLVLAEGVRGRDLAKGYTAKRETYQMPTIKNRSGKYRRYATTTLYSNLHSTK